MLPRPSGIFLNTPVVFYNKRRVATFRYSVVKISAHETEQGLSIISQEHAPS